MNLWGIEEDEIEYSEMIDDGNVGMLIDHAHGNASIELICNERGVMIYNVDGEELSHH